MDTHVRTLGTLNILFGVFSLLFSLTVFVVFGGPITLYTSMSDNILGALLATSAIFHMVLGIPCIIGGVYLRSFAEWARGVSIVTSALNVLNVPLGSALGGYGLWVLLAEETDPLFSNPPPDRRPKKAAQAAGSNVALNAANRASGAMPETQPQKPATTTIIPSPRS
jgi:hypothetical protein